MRAAGYGCYWYDGAALHARQAGDQAVNYFFLTDSHLATLAETFAGSILK